METGVAKLLEEEVARLRQRLADEDVVDSPALWDLLHAITMPKEGVQMVSELIMLAKMVILVEMEQVD